jgi:RNA polymerase sigma factor (sigma-70 family)
MSEEPEAERDDEPSVARGWDEFAPVYDEHHERLYRVALLLCHGSEAMAEDAVAETFLRIFPAWAEGRIDNVFSFARQTLVNHVIGQHRTDEVATRYAGTQRGDGRGDRPIDDSIADASTTFQLLEQLAPRQRTAVVLRYFEDLSYDQIASTMGVTSGTAKAQVSVGLQRMRDMMGDEGNGEDHP